MKARDVLTIAAAGIVVFGVIRSNPGHKPPQKPEIAPSPSTKWYMTGILLNDSSPYLVQGSDGNLYKAQWTAKSETSAVLRRHFVFSRRWSELPDNWRHQRRKQPGDNSHSAPDGKIVPEPVPPRTRH
jgi:hypothetical protein